MHLYSNIKFITFVFGLLSILTLGMVSYTAHSDSGKDLKLTDHATAPHIEVELISESNHLLPAHIHWLAVHFTPEEHWHTYWQNPGDSGIAPNIQWELPEGFSAGPIQWGFPEAIDVSGIINLGYHHQNTLLIPITTPDSLTNSMYSLKADISWLVCKESCIPGDAKLSVMVPSEGFIKSNVTLPQSKAILFSNAREKLPDISNSIAFYDVKDEVLTARFSLSEIIQEHPKLKNAHWEVFPTKINFTEPSGRTQLAWVNEDTLIFSQTKSLYFENVLPSLEFVLVANQKNAWQISAKHSPEEAQLKQGENPIPLSSTSISKTSETPQTSASLSNILYYLLFAMIGGLILNLMPCVFPILAVKAMMIVKSNHPSEVKLHGFLYLAGVLISFLALAIVLWALRFAGHQIGWGFHLQSPLFIASLASLFLIMAMNLWGMFEITGQWMNLGQSLAQKKNHWQPFFTGVLAVLVATPCTAPFMASALGFALIQPWYVLILIFLGLGFGMALPFVMISLFPSLQKFLPKPGQWMVTFKQAMAFPLLFTVIWLLWVLGDHIAITSLLICWVSVLCILWVTTKIHHRFIATLLKILAAIVIAFYVLFSIQTQTSLNNSSTPHSKTIQTNHGWKIDKIAYTPQSLLEAQQKEQVVFVNMTADWCVTCKINERAVLSRKTVQEEMKKLDVIYIEGDWTRNDPLITDYLQSFQRAGVPLYVVYSKNAAGSPQVLPQILTEKTLIEALHKANQT